MSEGQTNAGRPDEPTASPTPDSTSEATEYDDALADAIAASYTPTGLIPIMTPERQAAYLRGEDFADAVAEPSVPSASEPRVVTASPSAPETETAAAAAAIPETAGTGPAAEPSAGDRSGADRNFAKQPASSPVREVPDARLWESAPPPSRDDQESGISAPEPLGFVVPEPEPLLWDLDGSVGPLSDAPIPTSLPGGMPAAPASARALDDEELVRSIDEAPSATALGDIERLESELRRRETETRSATLHDAPPPDPARAEHGVLPPAPVAEGEETPQPEIRLRAPESIEITSPLELSLIPIPSAAVLPATPELPVRDAEEEQPTASSGTSADRTVGADPVDPPELVLPPTGSAFAPETPYAPQSPDAVEAETGIETAGAGAVETSAVGVSAAAAAATAAGGRGAAPTAAATAAAATPDAAAAWADAPPPRVEPRSADDPPALVEPPERDGVDALPFVDSVPRGVLEAEERPLAPETASFDFAQLLRDRDSLGDVADAPVADAPAAPASAAPGELPDTRPGFADLLGPEAGSAPADLPPPFPAGAPIPSSLPAPQLASAPPAAPGPRGAERDEEAGLRLDPRLVFDPELIVSDAAATDADYSDEDDDSVDPSDRIAADAGPQLPPRAPDAASAVPGLAPPPEASAFAPGPPTEAMPAPVTGVAAVPAPVSVVESPTELRAAEVQQELAPALPSPFEVEPTGLEPTPLERRAARSVQQLWIWFAANASVLSVALGAILLAAGLNLRQALVATVLGLGLSCLPLALGVIAGRRSGQPTLVVSRASFGLVGNILPATIGVLSRAFWGGALLWLVAASVPGVIVSAGLAGEEATTLLAFAGLALGGLLVVGIVCLGFGLIVRLQLVLSILSAVLIAGVIALTSSRLDLESALATPDGPWLLLVSGAVLVFSVIGIAWAHSGSDLARYQRGAGSTAGSGSSGALWASIGLILPPLVLIGWGSLLAASDPALAEGLAVSPLAALGSLLPGWYPLPLLFAAVLGALAAAALSVYSGGFALQSLGIRAPRVVGALISAALAVAVAVGLVLLDADAASLVRDAATALAVPVAAWAGILTAETALRRGALHARSLLHRGGAYPDIRIVNTLGLVLISVLGLGLTHGELAGLDWQGYLLAPLGFGGDGVLAESDLGVLVALGLGLLLPLVTAIPTIRRQEQAAARAQSGPSHTAALVD